MEETMKKLTLVLLAVLGLASALPSAAGAVYLYPPSQSGG
jgi:hypothetical protein